MTGARPDPVRLAVLGAGAIGRKHAALVAASPAVRLVGLADPSPAAQDLAAALSTACYPDLETLLDKARPEGVIVATPNALHVDNALACIAAGVPVLVEKPLATDPAAGRALVDAAARAGVALLVGHHRRYNPVIAAAKAALDAGRIGRPVMVNAQTWLMKPDPYFDVAWRRRAGAGPIQINLIHDIDLMRHFCGDIARVQAVASHALRGFEVEDSAAVIVQFVNGAVGTLSVSDTAVAPWSWELTAAENPDYPATGQSSYQIAGTLGALEVPTLRLWRNPAATGWHEPLSATALAADRADPLALQIAHFASVIRGQAAPLVSGADGLAAIEVLDAVLHAARTGETVHLNPRAEAP